MHLPVTVCVPSQVCVIGEAVAAKEENKHLPSCSIIPGIARLDALLQGVTWDDILNYLLRALKS